MGSVLGRRRGNRRAWLTPNQRNTRANRTNVARTPPSLRRRRANLDLTPHLPPHQVQSTTPLNQIPIPTLPLTTRNPSKLIHPTNHKLRQPTTNTLIARHNLTLIRLSVRHKKPLISKPIIRTKRPNQITMLFTKRVVISRTSLMRQHHTTPTISAPRQPSQPDASHG